MLPASLILDSFFTNECSYVISAYPLLTKCEKYYIVAVVVAVVVDVAIVIEFCHVNLWLKFVQYLVILSLSLISILYFVLCSC